MSSRVIPPCILLTLHLNMRNGRGVDASRRFRSRLRLTLAVLAVDAGSIASTTEEPRNMRTAAALERMWQETRCAGRRLLRSPAFTLASVLTLALAIGATASIFAVVERVVLKPLPYPASDRLVVIDHGAERLNLPSGLNFTPGLYYHYSERARTLGDIAIYSVADVTLTGDGSPERISVVSATPSLGRVLRVSPELGRWLAE